jgi:hypothetical protein
LSKDFDKAYVYYDGKFRSVPRKTSLKTISSFIIDHPKLFTYSHNNIFIYFQYLLLATFLKYQFIKEKL